jgi:hypothetical protein
MSIQRIAAPANAKRRPGRQETVVGLRAPGRACLGSTRT